jgi:maleylpyruvate isomerase
MLTLYDFWRSSAAYRVRIGLNLKGVAYEAISVNLKPGVEEQLGPAYRAINAQARVPSLRTPDGVLTQSLAILDWLDATYPEPAFFPGDRWTRVKVTEFALAIACDIHPINNSGTVRRLKAQFDASDEDITRWSQHWIAVTYDALEARLEAGPAHPFCFGDAPTLADICLIPQCANARRVGFDLSAYPRISAIDAHARVHPAFAAAAPERQKDAPRR